MGSVRLIQQQIEALLKFLEPLLGFANCHMVDFFTGSCYKNFVPLDIQQEIDDIGEEKVPSLIFDNVLNGAPALKTFIDDSVKLTLKNCDVCLSIDTFTQELRNWGCDNIDQFKLEVFMSAKKSHEVEILSAVVAAVSDISKTSHVVDIGDGKGYLSSMLALHNKIAVLGVDASNVNTCGAIKRVKKLSKVWNSIPNAPHKSYPKKNENATSTNVNLYKQVTQFVGEDFDVGTLIIENFGVSTIPQRLGLVGLHTCGNLAPNKLKMFVKNDSIKTICNVGCCYHLLTERFDKSEDCSDFGFPLSKFLIEKQLSIGRSARMIANQSVERILQAKELPNITIFYRALLQVILEKFCLELPVKHVGKFRKPPENFRGYVRTSLKRIDVDMDITDEQIQDCYSSYEKRLNELNIFYLLRCKLAPAIESLILLDRLLYLKERGFEKSFLVQFFDPVVSPRCYGVVALKK